ncbi:MAG: response regulator [Bacteroidales bacterium]
METSTLPRILVVDDIDTNLLLIETILKRENAEIIMARSGSEALEKVSDIDIALMILDVSMPEMNGFELAEHLREMERHKYTPIIFVSAIYSDDSSIFKGYKSGAVDYITKPFKHEILSSKVRIFLQLAVQNEKIREQSQRLHESEERYRSYIENAPDGVFVVTQEGEVAQLNNAIARITGYSKEELKGMNFVEFFKSDNLVSENDMFPGIFSGDKSGGEFRITTPTKQIKYVLAETVKLPDGRYLGFLKDNTDQHELVKQLLQSERLAGIGELAAGIAHEINQPLNTIAFSLDNLFDALKTQHTDVTYIQKKADKIFEGILRMRNIIDHVRTFSRDQENYIPMAFDVSQSIANALSMVSEQYKKQGILLETQLGLTSYMPIGNTYKFEQVILNLLSNAHDAIDEKSARSNDLFKGIITVSSIQTSKELVISVKDNGIGIDANKLAKVLLPFYTTKEAGKGTGLGLSISYGIIKEMGGEISIDSSTDEGSTIRVILPVINQP